jgi:hypothetical protein
MTNVESFRRDESSSSFRREPLPMPAGNSFVRLLTARAIASMQRVPAADVAARLWPSDKLVQRAASAPAMTSVAGWAAELAHKRIVDTLAAMGAAAAAADVMKQSLVLDWDGAGIISAPGFVASAANSGFVAEGNPIPVRQLNASAVQLTPTKLATIAVLTREMIESSNAEQLISDALIFSSGLALDAVFFGSAAATAAQPAGIRNGIAALTPSANTDAFGAFFEDMATLLNAVGQVGGKGPFFIVSSIGRLASASGRYGSLKAEGTDATIIPVSSLAVGNDVVVIAPKALVAALSADPEVETVNSATLVMDTTPVAPDTTLATKGMFQTDSVAVKVRWPITWALRNPAAVAWLTPSWK